MVFIFWGFFCKSWYHESNMHSEQQSNTKQHFQGMKSFPSICGYELQCPTLTHLPQLGLAAEGHWCDLASQILKASLHRKDAPSPESHPVHKTASEIHRPGQRRSDLLNEWNSQENRLEVQQYCKQARCLSGLLETSCWSKLHCVQTQPWWDLPKSKDSFKKVSSRLSNASAFNNCMIHRLIIALPLCSWASSKQGATPICSLLSSWIACRRHCPEPVPTSVPPRTGVRNGVSSAALSSLCQYAARLHTSFGGDGRQHRSSVCHRHIRVGFSDKPSTFVTIRVASQTAWQCLRGARGGAG